MDLKEMVLKGMDWIDPAQERHKWWAGLNKAVHLWIPHNACKFLIRSSSRTLLFAVC
jgi:hypothetical protein